MYYENNNNSDFFYFLPYIHRRFPIKRIFSDKHMDFGGVLFCTIKFIKFFQAPLPVLIIRTNHTNYNVKKEHKHVCQFENYVDNLHYAIM